MYFSLKDNSHGLLPGTLLEIGWLPLWARTHSSSHTNIFCLDPCQKLCSYAVVPSLSRTEPSGEKQPRTPFPYISNGVRGSTGSKAPALSGCPDSARNSQPSEVCCSTCTCPRWRLPPSGPLRVPPLTLLLYLSLHEILPYSQSPSMGTCQGTKTMCNGVQGTFTPANCLVFPS